MKFINYLEQISGVSIFPLISLMIFFIFFALLLFYVLKTDKNYFKKIGELPLDNN
ncbi:MAG: CcoQ/FixQ family Cbb3-type cytochrome c oxidase assembly chaperone [Bacteroidota bacterium]|nr:CcoQ/FixQ family Cbb3-type cytochrome c oxidase assembly chaperone [Bacteroidota bacterium]